MQIRGRKNKYNTKPERRLRNESSFFLIQTIKENKKAATQHFFNFTRITKNKYQKQQTTATFFFQTKNQQQNLKEINETKSKTRREFPCISTHIKPNNQKYSVTLGEIKTLEKA